MSHLMFLALTAEGVLGGVMTAIGLGGLIFFHELGHFLACRVTGTRVEAFSIGFGPKLFGWRRGETVYKLCIIPLGGYVKMAAENPGDERSEDPAEFPNKSFSAKVLIMSAGVIFNGILACLLFAWAFGLGVPQVRAQVGTVTIGGAAWDAGMQRGDIVRAVDGKRILDFSDLSVAVALSDAEEERRFTIERGDETIELDLTPRYSEMRGMVSIGVARYFIPEAAEVTDGSPAAKAGARPGDRILAVNGLPVRGVAEAQGVLSRLAGSFDEGVTTLAIVMLVRSTDGSVAALHFDLPIDESPQVGIVPYYGRRIAKVRKDGPMDGLLRPGDLLLAVNGAPVADLHQFSDGAQGLLTVESIRVKRDGKETTLTPSAPLTDRQMAEGIAAAAWDRDSTRVSPRDGMPAARAGMLAGDLVLSVGDKEIESWPELQERILDHGKEPVEIRIKREDGSEHTLKVVPAGRASLLDAGFLFKPPLEFAKESSFTGAVALGWNRTVDNAWNVIRTLKGLITANVSARHVGGPIAIARMTYGMFEHGWASYLYLLALISINLAILNLLPIPVLDGGQIMILIAEKIRGKALPETAVHYLQLVGVVLILGLIGLALTNDITNMFR